MVGSHSHERSIEYAYVARNFSATKSGMKILEVRPESSELTRIISIIGWKQRWEVYCIDYSKFEQLMKNLCHCLFEWTQGRWAFVIIYLGESYA
jgi:hypothetical protein